MLVAASLKLASVPPPITRVLVRPSAAGLQPATGLGLSSLSSSTTMTEDAFGLGRERMLQTQSEPSWEGHAHGCGQPGREPCHHHGTVVYVPNGDGAACKISACTSWRRCAISERPWPCAPCCLASCQRTTRCRMSSRDQDRRSVRELNLASILAGKRCDLDIHYSAPLAESAFQLPSAEARKAAGLRILGQRHHGVAHQNPGTLVPGNGAADRDEATLDIGRDDLDVLR